jgi:hypothetical protein
MASLYAKIPGLGTGRGVLQLGLRCRIYAAPDHLLIVFSTGYSEEYKRIFYQDIHYLVIRKTHGQVRQGMISGLFVLAGVSPFLFGASRPVAITFATISFPFFIWFLVNLLRGPACECQVNTAVQTLKLPVPRRMNKVSLMIDFLRSKTAPPEPGVTEPAGP